MTDQTNPSAPKIPRKKPRGEPATIDLPATVVEETRPVPEPSASEAERIREAVAIEMGAPLDAESPSDASGGRNEPPSPPGSSADEFVENARTPGNPSGAGPRAPSLAPIIASALLGGVVGAGLLFALDEFQSPSESPRLAALEQRVSSLPQSGAQTTAVQALTARIQALEAAKASSDQRLAAAQSATERALNRPAAPDTQDHAAIAELNQRLSTMEGQLQSNQQAVVTAREVIGTRVEDLSKRISQDSDSATKAAVRIVLAQRLGESLRLGTPYAETLEALRANGTDAARLSSVEPFAQKGAPTAAALARTFQPLSAAILRDDRAVAGSFTDRLLRMADRVVTIRPVDEPGSTDVASLVARIEQALERGNVQEAVSTWETLPEPARRLSEEWAARAKARAAADAGARAVAEEAIAALTHPAR